MPFSGTVQHQQVCWHLEAQTCHPRRVTTSTGLLIAIIAGGAGEATNHGFSNSRFWSGLFLLSRPSFSPLLAQDLLGSRQNATLVSHMDEKSVNCAKKATGRLERRARAQEGKLRGPIAFRHSPFATAWAPLGWTRWRGRRDVDACFVAPWTDCRPASSASRLPARISSSQVGYCY